MRTKAFTERRAEYMLFGLPVTRSSARGVWWLAALYLGALAVAALLAPALHALLQAWHEASPNAFTERAAGRPFPRTFDRLRWLPTLVALPFLLQACGLLSWRALGVRFCGTGWRQFGFYFLAGVGLLALAASFQAWHYGARLRLGLSAVDVASLVLAALVGGILIGLLEEIVFRGMVFRMFYTWVRPGAALLLTALFFSYAHFKFPAELWDPHLRSGSWMDGWWVAFWTLGGIVHSFDALVFLNLALFGVVLGMLVLRGNSLMPAIGFHAGIVAAIAAYTGLTDVQDITRRLEAASWFWGTGGMRDGLLTTTAFVFMLAFLIYGGGGARRGEKNPSAGKPAG